MGAFVKNLMPQNIKLFLHFPIHSNKIQEQCRIPLFFKDRSLKIQMRRLSFRLSLFYKVNGSNRL